MVGVYVIFVILYGLVIIGRKGFIVGFGKNNYVNCVIIMIDVKCVDYFGDCYWGEGIVFFWLVYCNFGDFIVVFKNNFGIFFNGGLVSICYNKFFYKI